MAESNVIILAVVQLLFWCAIIFLAGGWLIRFIIPQVGRRKMFYRFFVFRPLKQATRQSLHLIHQIATNRPIYHRRQLYLENYAVTPLAFYGAFEEVLRQRQIIGVEILQTARYEWNLFSGRRIYVLIRFRDAVFFIGAVTLGTSFLISWQYTTMPGRFLLILFQIPFLGIIAEKMLRPATFYRTDVYHAFEQIMRSTVLETMNLLTLREGVRPLTDGEQRPLLREFYE